MVARGAAVVRVAEVRVKGVGGWRGEQKEQTNNGLDLDLLDLDGYVDLGHVLA